MSAAGQLPQPFEALAPLLDHYGYLAVGGLLFVEDFGIPVPGETVLIAASLYAGIGRLNVVAVAVVAFAAALLGDNLGYLIGRKGGRPLLERVGKYVFLTPARLDRGEEWFNKHGDKIVVVARFIDGLRQLNGLIAGTIEMHWLRFLIANAIGSALWVGTWVSLGYFAGNHVDTVAHYITYIGGGLLALAVLTFVVRHVRERRRRAAEGGTDDAQCAEATGGGAAADASRPASPR
jgi:membrane protein DedA with SNARE-associated domain